MKTSMTIIGIEAMSGVGKTSNKAYAIGRLHTAINLAPPMVGGVAKGSIGTTYDCDPELVKKIAHLTFPLTVEAELMDQMKFGKREQVVVDLRPLEVVRKVA